MSFCFFVVSKFVLIGKKTRQKRCVDHDGSLVCDSIICEAIVNRMSTKEFVTASKMSNSLPTSEKGQCNELAVHRSTSLAIPNDGTTNDQTETAVQVTTPPSSSPAVVVGWTSSKVIRRAFGDRALEDLYLNYCQRSRESDLDCFFLTGCLVAVHTAVALSLKQLANFDQEFESRVLICAGVSSVVAVAQASLGFYIRGRKTVGNVLAAGEGLESANGAGHSGQQQAANVTGRLTYTAWLLANVLILGLLALVPSPDQGTRALTWLLLVNFLTFVTLPLRLRVCLLLTSVASLLFLVVSAFNSWDVPVEMASAPADASPLPSVTASSRPSLHQQVA